MDSSDVVIGFVGIRGLVGGCNRIAVRIHLDYGLVWLRHCAMLMRMNVLHALLNHFKWHFTGASAKLRRRLMGTRDQIGQHKNERAARTSL